MYGYDRPGAVVCVTNLRVVAITVTIKPYYKYIVQRENRYKNARTYEVTQHFVMLHAVV
jgi:hypothetical protein